MNHHFRFEVFIIFRIVHCVEVERVIFEELCKYSFGFDHSQILSDFGKNILLSAIVKNRLETI